MAFDALLWKLSSAASSTSVTDLRTGKARLRELDGVIADELGSVEAIVLHTTLRHKLHPFVVMVRRGCRPRDLLALAKGALARGLI